uniref:Uncharacterized protein n=1 Tax=Anguilla anguilla TaxID=7936 RepID=A0A0E9T2R7_ANGAN
MEIHPWSYMLPGWLDWGSGCARSPCEVRYLYQALAQHSLTLLSVRNTQSLPGTLLLWVIHSFMVSLGGNYGSEFYVYGCSSPLVR